MVIGFFSVIHFSILFHNFQLDRCNETDCRQVFEINLNGQALEQIPSLKEVRM